MLVHACHVLPKMLQRVFATWLGVFTTHEAGAASASLAYVSICVQLQTMAACGILHPVISACLAVSLPLLDRSHLRRSNSEG